MDRDLSDEDSKYSRAVRAHASVVGTEPECCLGLCVCPAEGILPSVPPSLLLSFLLCAEPIPSLQAGVCKGPWAVEKDGKTQEENFSP